MQLSGVCGSVTSSATAPVDVADVQEAPVRCRRRIGQQLMEVRGSGKESEPRHLVSYRPLRHCEALCVSFKKPPLVMTDSGGNPHLDINNLRDVQLLGSAGNRETAPISTVRTRSGLLTHLDQCGSSATTLLVRSRPNRHRSSSVPAPCLDRRTSVRSLCDDRLITEPPPNHHRTCTEYRPNRRRTIPP